MAKCFKSVPVVWEPNFDPDEEKAFYGITWGTPIFSITPEAMKMLEEAGLFDPEPDVVVE
jgi:hypothetical protein